MTDAILSARPARTTVSLSAILTDVARNGARWTMIGIGTALIAAGFLMTPLPGPLGVPVTVLGLIMVLRNSFWAKRKFIQAQHRNPKMVFPLRRLMRREPQLASLAWQQTLRFEKMVLPRRMRRAKAIRRRYFRRRA